MSAMGGDELFHHFRSIDPTVEAVFLTAETDLPLALKVVKLGAFDYLSKPLTLPRLLTVVLRALEHRALILENRAYHERLESLVAERTTELNKALARLGSAHIATLDALGLALDFRDQSTSGHSRRVANLTKGIAREIGISGDALVQIEDGALLHDIGKLRIPDSILLKPGSLSSSEWKIMRCHAEYGRQFLERIDSLSGASQIVYAHHEKFNGKGYPRGLKAEEIPVGARCFAIVDAIDALIYERPYHKAIPFEMAAEEVKRCSGSHFDPELVDIALRHIAARLPEPFSTQQSIN
jgi:putative nucleotidyltransferase with HDIG domain